MKRFLRLSWRGIPIGLIASILICTAVVAAGVYFAVTQTITQEIIEEPEPDYGTITVDTATLPQVYKNGSFSKTIVGGVQVQLGPDGAGKALKMDCTPDSKYTSFGVTITLTDKPAGSGVMLAGYGITGGGVISVDLDVPGLYIFD
ncbi:unnamed protein product, partial [marine sediment metagenome]